MHVTSNSNMGMYAHHHIHDDGEGPVENMPVMKQTLHLVPGGNATIQNLYLPHRGLESVDLFVALPRPQRGLARTAAAE